jgi:hypothetical protein
MAKKIKYPEIGMRDSIVDRLKKSPTAAKGTVEVSNDTSSSDMQNTKGSKTKLKSKFQSVTTTSDDSGNKVLDYSVQKSGKSKDSRYYLEMKEGTRSKLAIQKGNRERNISGTRSERKVDRVFNRNNK